MTAFSWKVELPDHKRKAYPASGGRALLSWADGHSRPIAAATGRALRKAEREGFAPSSSEELQVKLEALDAEQAWSWLLASLNRRDLSHKEAVERLSRKGFGQKAALAAVERAERLRLMGDARYLEVFTRQKVAQGWGRRRIERALEEKGIDARGQEGWADAHFSVESEIERAQALLRRRSLPERNAYEKWVRFLAGRGFDFGVAKEAVRAELRRRDGEDDD